MTPAMPIPDRCAELEAELAAVIRDLGYQRQRNAILKADNNELRDALVALRLVHRDLVRRCAESGHPAAFTDPDDPAPPVRTLPARAYRQPRKPGWEAMR
jgi:hypothetical protein